MRLPSLAGRALFGLRASCAAIALAVTPALAAQPVVLKDDVQVSGPAVTLGDVFDGVPESASGIAIAPAPKPGRSMREPMAFLTAVASAGGLDFAPPPGVDFVVISNRARGGAAPSTRQYAELAAADVRPASVTSAAVTIDAAIHRGETVTLVYIAPGLQLTTRAKALNDATIGGAVRVVNLQSNRVVDAVATGPGAASASPGPSF